MEQDLLSAAAMLKNQRQILKNGFKATPHKARLTALHVICLRFSCHLAQKLLDIRQYACVVFVQSDEKIGSASAAQSLCGVALRLSLDWQNDICRSFRRFGQEQYKEE